MTIHSVESLLSLHDKAARHDCEPLRTKYRNELSAALTEALAPTFQPDQQLCGFYQVSSFPELVTAMERHIDRLQAKLPPLRDTQPGRVREG